jgi:hypothetical protein
MDLLKRPDGVGLRELMKATGWHRELSRFKAIPDFCQSTFPAISAAVHGRAPWQSHFFSS